MQLDKTRVAIRERSFVDILDLALADSAGDGPWPITAEQVYSERFMFHGPAFQCVAGLGTLGNPGATGALAVRARDRLFASVPDPLLLTDPCVMDGVGQVVGLCAKMNGLCVLPIGVDRVEFYCPPPPPGTTVPIRIEVVELDRGGFACALGGPGRTTLFITAAEWRGMSQAEMVTPGSGQVVMASVEVPGAGWP